jgi:3-oxoadipate enol-lactonase
MAFVENEGARVYWNSLGQGEPIVMLMGLGCSSAMWYRVAPRLAKRHRVILIDNRGAGHTRVPYALVHRVVTMARDVCAVLDAAGVASANVVGFSMGGMIAQQMAIDHPQRVRSLALLGTNCGGSDAILAEPKVWKMLFDKGSVTPEESLHAMRQYVYARATLDRRIEQDHVVRLANFPTLRGYQSQLYGLMGWSSYSRLPRVQCPTLVLHGNEDQLIPPANAKLLADRIPGAELTTFDDASHWLATDQTDAVVSALNVFLRKHRAGAAA